MSYKLYSFFGNHLSNAIFIAGELAGLKIEPVYVSFEDI